MPEANEYVKKLIKVEFTESELLELGRELSDHLSQLKNLENQKSVAAADFTSRIKHKNLSIDETMQKIDNGFEVRQEECLVEYDHALNMVHYIFKNDGKRIIVEQRKMTHDERQMGLDFDGLEVPEV